MMEYKRLTNKNLDEYNPEYDFCIGCKHFGEPNGCNRSNGTCANYERFMETYNRLAELEDKIEQGTLKEMNYPCYFDDKVFVIRSKTSNGKNLYIIEDRVKNLSVSKSADIKYHFLYIDLYENPSIFEWDFDKVCKSREEAKKRLKEIQE